MPRKWSSLLIALLCLFFVSACSDDDPIAVISSSSQPTMIEDTGDDPYQFSGDIKAVRDLIEALAPGLSAESFSSEVTVIGIVHAVKAPGVFWIQDRDAGILVSASGKSDLPSLGDEVKLTATHGGRDGEIFQISGYKDLNIESKDNIVYRQMGILEAGTEETGALQGQAWFGDVYISKDLGSNASSSVEVYTCDCGLKVHNASGATLKTGVYHLRGPVYQEGEEFFIEVLPGMYEFIKEKPGPETSEPFEPSEDPPAPPVNNERIRIGSFNIQIFGKTKVDRPNTLTILASIATNFDIMAIQEVGSNGHPKDETCIYVMDKYTARVNELLNITNYTYVRGHQYAYLYRSDKIEHQGSGLYSDETKFTYTPLAGKFKAKNGNFDFVLLTIHTSPSKAKTEIPALKEAMTELAITYSDPDVICLGDFNAGGSYFSPGPTGGDLAGWPASEYTTIIKNGNDTTVATGNDYTYDRIQTTSYTDEDYTGDSGVFYFGRYYDMSVAEGPASTIGTEGAISDHYPVWAEFYIDKDSD